MSQENVETVRRMHDAFARGDFQMSLSCFDPEIELSTPAQEPNAATYHGLEGVRRGTNEWVGGLQDFRIEVEQLTDLGEHVLARIREHGRGKSSGVEVERQLFQLFTLRDGKIVRLRMYEDDTEALEAAGLSE